MNPGMMNSTQQNMKPVNKLKNSYTNKRNNNFQSTAYKDIYSSYDNPIYQQTELHKASVSPHKEKKEKEEKKKLKLKFSHRKECVQL